MKTIRNTKPATVADLRIEIAALHAERADLANSGPTRTELEAQITTQCHHAATSDEAQRMRNLVANGMAYEAFTLDHRKPPQIAHNLMSVFAAVLGPGRLAAALHEHIAHLPDGSTAAERTARVVAINAELDRLEADEERLIEASELAGAPIARRADARPEIILAVA